jgi:hypothetical protein
MNQDFRSQRITDLAAALLAAAGGKRSKPASSTTAKPPLTAKEVAASFNMENDEDVSNIVAVEMMQIQEANK